MALKTAASVYAAQSPWRCAHFTDFVRYSTTKLILIPVSGSSFSHGRCKRSCKRAFSEPVNLNTATRVRVNDRTLRDVTGVYSRRLV